MNKILLILGLLLLLGPVAIRMVERNRQTDCLATYENEMRAVDDDLLQETLSEAREYNRSLYEQGWISMEHYQNMLCFNGETTEMMGSIEIPKIGLKLPIRHGTSEAVLSTSIGHMPESSLPVGGVNTHSVLTGHRGLPSAELFTRLDELEQGDYFLLTVCREKMIYRVCQIQVVLPEAVESIAIQDSRDLVSLVTCTPYGLNTHRLIVTGERIPDGMDVAIMEPRQSVSKWDGIPIAVAAGCIFVTTARWIYQRYRKRKGKAYAGKRKYQCGADKRHGRHDFLCKSRRYATGKVRIGAGVSQKRRRFKHS